MALTRQDLRAVLPQNSENVIDRVMELYGSSVKDLMTADDAKKQADEALKGYDVKNSEAYKALETNFTNYKAKMSSLQSADFEPVKSKFREDVYNRLDHSEKAKPIAEQLTGIKSSFPEFFTDDQVKTPVGSAPKGNAPEGTKPDDITSYYRRKFGK